MRNSCLFLAAFAVAPSGPLVAQASSLRDSLAGLIATSGAEISVAYHNLATGDTLYLGADKRFHAASTMKVPVLIELARRIDAGDLGWEDSVPVTNRFTSIVDSSAYSLSPGDDSDSLMYALVDRKVPVRFLAEHMIRWSSNLATNVLIEILSASRVNATAHALGADSIAVLRGVEDIKAYEKGLSNTTTARDLDALFTAIADGRAASEASTRIMLSILEGQEFNSGIPAGLPEGTRVAHKTGSITGIAHDGGIVYPEGADPYVLVVLTRGFEEHSEADVWISRISEMMRQEVGKSGSREVGRFDLQTP